LNINLNGKGKTFLSSADSNPAQKCAPAAENSIKTLSYQIEHGLAFIVTPLMTEMQMQPQILKISGLGTSPAYLNVRQ
jgi:hypothetical protein